MNCHVCLDGKLNKQGQPILASRMILRPDCGNKRCPRATDHTLSCTARNEPGQAGSVWENYKI